MVLGNKVSVNMASVNKDSDNTVSGNKDSVNRDSVNMVLEVDTIPNHQHVGTGARLPRVKTTVAKTTDNPPITP